MSVAFKYLVICWDCGLFGSAAKEPGQAKSKAETEGWTFKEKGSQIVVRCPSCAKADRGTP